MDNPVFSLFKNKKKDILNDTSGSSDLGRAVPIKSRQEVDNDTIRKAKAIGMSDQAIKRVIDQADRDDFESDINNYRTTLANKPDKTYEKNEKKRISEEYGLTEDNFNTAITQSRVKEINSQKEAEKKQMPNSNRE